MRRIAIIIIWLATLTSAANIDVKHTGGDYDNLKSAIDAATTGDIIRVYESGTDYEMPTGATVSDGRTILICGVKESDSSCWYAGCGWTRPTVLATGSSMVMIQLDTAAGSLLMNGIEMDGGGSGKATSCIVSSGSLAHNFGLFNCLIGNATAAQIYGVSSGYLQGLVNQCEIYGGTGGIVGAAGRMIPHIQNSSIHGCSSYGVWTNYSSTSGMVFSNNVVYGCGVGFHTERYGYNPSITIASSVFHNTLDMQFEYVGSTTFADVRISRCIFYGTTAFNPDNESADIGFVAYNCLFRSGITKTQAGATGYVTEYNSRDLTGDPFTNSSGGDYSFDPADADFDLVWQWSGGGIGPFGPSEPAGSGGGTVRKPRPLYLGN